MYVPSILYCTTGSFCAYPLSPIPFLKSSMLSKCSIHLSSTTLSITTLSSSGNSFPIFSFFSFKISNAFSFNSCLNTSWLIIAFLDFISFFSFFFLLSDFSSLTSSTFSFSSSGTESIVKRFIISCLNNGLFKLLFSISSWYVFTISSTVSVTIFWIISSTSSPFSTTLLCAYIISLCAFITSS